MRAGTKPVLRKVLGVAVWALLLAPPALGFIAIAAYSLVPMTQEDFRLPGTAPGSLHSGYFEPSETCRVCHGDFDPVHEPFADWHGSLMGMAGRDPLFYAQMTTANQDVANVGTYCLRCHVPMSTITGTALDPTGASLTAADMDGVSCHLCHTMVDPVYKPGVSPARDESILAALDEVPDRYGNAMIVFDPEAVRRGPRAQTIAPHDVIESAFHRSASFCGSCHDVGNLAVSRRPDGTYRYNAIDEASPSDDPWEQFPLERTYTEWKLSAFAAGGVDMGGRFGGVNAAAVSTCQDCHMPRAEARACFYAPDRPDMASHDFAGASAWVLEIIGLYAQDIGDTSVEQAAVARGRDKAVDMLRRAVSLETHQHGSLVRVRVVNESGHKIPTGHIEGRRIWVSLVARDASGAVLREFGAYDRDEAHLDEASTTVFEMHVGLSAEASQATGYPAGVTTHMALADVIVKDNRIPPRGFANEAFAAGGAPVVGAAYADGQHWADVWFAVPEGAATVEASVHYQTVTRHYIEALRDANTTDDWGETLYDLWLRTEKGAPIEMAALSLALDPFLAGDLDGDGEIGLPDLSNLLASWGPGHGPADLNADGRVDTADLGLLIRGFGRRL